MTRQPGASARYGHWPRRTIPISRPQLKPIWPPSARPRGRSLFRRRLSGAPDLIALTNSAWRFSRGDTARRFKLARLLTINDSKPLALGAEDRPRWAALPAPGNRGRRGAQGRDRPGDRPRRFRPIPVSGAGADVRWFALPAKAGVGFAPQGELEIDLLRFLKRRHNRASAERVLSGQGLENLYEFLAERAGLSGQRLTPADITTRGLVEGDALARAAWIFSCRCSAGWLGILRLHWVRAAASISAAVSSADSADLASEYVHCAFSGQRASVSAMLTPIPIFVIRDSSAALLRAATALRGTGERP